MYIRIGATLPNVYKINRTTNNNNLLNVCWTHHKLFLLQSSLYVYMRVFSYAPSSLSLSTLKNTSFYCLSIVERWQKIGYAVFCCISKRCACTRGKTDFHIYRTDINEYIKYKIHQHNTIYFDINTKSWSYVYIMSLGG